MHHVYGCLLPDISTSCFIPTYRIMTSDRYLIQSASISNRVTQVDTDPLLQKILEQRGRLHSNPLTGA
jgi:hypothetical protein